MCDFPIYLINLVSRPDRRKHSFSEFKKLGISNVTRLPFTKDPRGGAYGVHDSHTKVWNHFVKNHPKKEYMLVFEDDFVATPKSISTIKKAAIFLNKNINNIDLLFLHDTCIPIESTLNTNFFTKGIGLLAHAYFITRNYIQTVCHTGIPAPNGRHIDFEINLNAFDKDNHLYTEKIFYTKNKCFTQLVESVSDNYINFIDELLKISVNDKTNATIQLSLFLKKHLLLDDKQLKKMWYIISRNIT